MRLAGIPDELSVWTGSCPCQPFSAAGRQRGGEDARHLWPEWFRLICECRPAVIFGEQVASADGLAWLDAVSTDLEGAGYAVGASDLCAAGIGAPHIRQRLYFMAYAEEKRYEWNREARRWRAGSSHDRGASELAHADEAGLLKLGDEGLRTVGDTPLRDNANRRREDGVVADANGKRTSTVSGVSRRPSRERHRSAGIVMGDASNARSQGQCRDGDYRDEPGRIDAIAAGSIAAASDASNPWAGCEWVACNDGVSRPIEPGTFPLAHGAPARVGRLRAYGNAIVPQVAATFIHASLDVMESA